MTAFKKLTAYSDVKCEWVSPTYPYDEENAQLQAENAKLRETLQRRSEQLDGMTEMWVERGVENIQLRELVEDMAAEIRGLGVDFKRVGWCDYADRMRELGIEVDG